MSELILEDTCWSAEDIFDYYEATKENYPYIHVASLSDIPASVTVVETQEYYAGMTYTPTDAQKVEEQIAFAWATGNIAYAYLA